MRLGIRARCPADPWAGSRISTHGEPLHIISHSRPRDIGQGSSMITLPQAGLTVSRSLLLDSIPSTGRTVGLLCDCSFCPAVDCRVTVTTTLVYHLCHGSTDAI